MEKKEILLLVFVFIFSGISLYMKYQKKKKTGTADGKMGAGKKSGLSGQPDDYDPYTGK
jgi:uncharacterized membrane protein